MQKTNKKKIIIRESCESCGRFKLYNTGGGLICTNLKCREGISIEQDYAEVDKLRNKWFTSQPTQILSSNTSFNEPC